VLSILAASGLRQQAIAAVLVLSHRHVEKAMSQPAAKTGCAKTAPLPALVWRAKLSWRLAGLAQW